MDKHASAAELVRYGMPYRPVIATRPHLLRRAATFFMQHFPGKTLYAVKANDTPEVIEELYRAGIRAFDVASLTEIQQLKAYDKAELYLMNPVKPRYVISEAYHNYGVRNFSLDSLDELNKILEETGNAKDLNLFVRVSCNGKGAQIALDDKFGVCDEDAYQLLMATRKAALKLGVAFHVGSQAMVPERYGEALNAVSAMIAKSGVLPDVIDVGGGFPSVYPGLTPPPLSSYMSMIETAFEKMNVVETCELLCEPGRALVAEASSLFVRVEHRKGQHLYINDGSYGCLHDAAHYGFVFPARLVRADGGSLGTLQPFALYGPTCDSADFMPGPFYLPSDVREGDFIEIGQLGAYGRVMTTLFNGFGRYEYVELEDEPIMSMYGTERSVENIEGLVALQKHI
ncbi:MAG: type III PLP-dependent enzyme [Methyloligellaceae bacterium]